MSRDREDDDESRCQKNALILGTMEEFQSSSSNPPTKPSSQNGREYINQYREDHDKMLRMDYFVPRSVYSSTWLRRRYRMMLHLFNRILHDVVGHCGNRINS
ncbi:hypothetical protein CerSpe_243760 [Prunus speciosa]